MSRVQVFLFSMVCIFSFAVKAMEINVFDKQMYIPPERVGAGGKKCADVFLIRHYGARTSSASPYGFRQHELEYYPEGQMSPRDAQAQSEIFGGWRRDPRIKDKKAVDLMEERAKQANPLRIKIITLKDQEHFSGIRIYDSSTHVQNYGMPWFVDFKEAVSPLEMRYGIRFPERSDGEPSYIWNLGLLISPEHFVRGTDSMFSNVAFILDAHYNGAEYRVFGDLSPIKNLNFQIYGNTKPELVDYYRQYGFEPIYQINRQGEVVTMEDGMVLIKVSGADFIENNFFRPSHPQTLSGGRAENSEWVKQQLAPLIKRNQMLREAPIPSGFKNFDHWMATFQSFTTDKIKQYQIARTEEEKAAIYLDVVGSLYLLLKADVVTKNDPNAAVKRVFIKELLVEGHEYGWAALSRWWSGEMNAKGALDSSTFRYEW